MSRWPTTRLRFLLNKAIPDAGRRLLEEAGEVTFLPMEAIGEQGKLDTSRLIKVDEAAAGYTLFFDGDVVVAKITPCFENGKGALIHSTATGWGLGTTELYVLRPGNNIDGKFLYWVTASPVFRILGEAQMTGSAGQKRVPEEFIRNYVIAVPSIIEQARIAEYLDTEIGVIDELVRAKVAWLGLLTEKRLVIVAQAAIRGLDPVAPLRPSGINWLGDIPAHWEVRRIATLFTQRDERSQPELPLLEVSINSGVIVREFSEDKIEGTASDFNTYKVARHGDIAFNKMRMWQGAVGVAPVDGLVSPDYTVAEPAPCLRPEYAGLIFKTASFSAECGRNSQGITWDRLRLYWDGFRDIFMPLPPLAEQDAILEAVQAETAKIDRLHAATEQSITLLKERRGALIAAAVTGQINTLEAA